MHSDRTVTHLMLRHVALIAFIVVAAGALKAQNYYDHWAFGSNVHMDFTAGAPTVSCNTSINSSEAAAVWSNPVTGDFIAYTSGSIVYNGQNHNVLANGTGLTANSSSIESALILPKPGASLDEFYVFHNNIYNTYWSEADMSIGTNGTVTSKNNFLQATGTERCGTVPHGNYCPAYWVVISKNTNDSVAAYLVDSNGIDTVPVVTATNVTTGGGARGNIVFSEDYSKIGMSVEYRGMYVADFNNITGETSNWVKIGNTTNGFGSAFSPDGTKVYYTSGYGQYLFQYNFLNTTQTQLGGPGLSYLALGPDGKIYISKYGQSTLGVINTPNVAGTGCGFQISGFTITGSCVCRWGLPNPFHVDIGYHPSTPDTITLCPGEDTLYTSQVNGDTFLWNTGATTASVLLNTPGLYYATIGFGDCSSSDSVYLQYASEVEIEASTVCLSDTTMFGYQSLMPASNIVSYSWSFGDGNTDTAAYPMHVYSTGDTFTVTLEIETQTGCVLDTALDIVVHPNPVPEFGFENVCYSTPVQFGDSATAGSAPIVSRYWDVDNDGSTDFTNNNPSKNYGSYGTYEIEYKVMDALGCVDSMVKEVYVHPLPSADFVTKNECFKETHLFYDSSAVAQGSIINWAWSYGDGNTDSVQNPNYSFSIPGQKAVKLVVTTDSGCVDSVVVNTKSYFLPVADFNADSVCENIPASLTHSSSTQSGNLWKYYWDFGDGDSAFAGNVQHNYKAPGLYSVAHTIVSSFGCRDTISKNIRIYPAPLTAFGWANKVCEGENLPFEDQSSILQITPGGDSILSWEWQIDGAPFSNDTNPVYATMDYASILVRLITTSNYGCITQSTNTAEIFPNPIASFTEFAACQHDTSRFHSTSSIPLGIVSDWFWNFGDGGTSTEPHPGHVYTAPGTYNVVMHVTSPKGCTDSASRAVVVNESPVVNFDFSPMEGCTELLVEVTNTSSIGAGSMTFEWYIDDELRSEESEPSFYLANDRQIPLFYSITLRAMSNHSCLTSMKYEDTIQVFPKPISRFAFLDHDFSKFEPLTRFENNSEYASRYEWRFGDGMSTVEFEPEHYYERSGHYDVVLTSWNPYGCFDTATKELIVDPVTMLYVPSAFTPNNDGFNDSWGISGYTEGAEFEVQIFDRWGHLLFESDQITFNWDGTYQDGNEAPIGSYVYFIVYETSENSEESLHGRFSLLR
jgi:gliding motility-associated-like protein